MLLDVFLQKETSNKGNLGELKMRITEKPEFMLLDLRRRELAHVGVS
jgi:hypothetical protein